MKLTQLQYFCKACEVGNMTRAARELCVSQPSVSMAIQELETEFGVELIRKAGQGFALTDEGRYFYERAGALLEQADGLKQMMCDLGNNRKRVNLGIPPMIGAWLFPQLYQEFSRKYPDISLATMEGGSRELLERLDEGALDLVIAPVNRLPDGPYGVLKIRETQTVFCVRKDHRLAGRESVSAEEIGREPVILFQEGFYQNQVIREQFARAGLEPNMIHASGQFYTIREFIAKGIAAGFMFRELADAAPELSGIPMKDPVCIDIGVIWRKDRHMFRAGALLIEEMRAAAG